MILDIYNKTINNEKYYVFDGIINGITIDNITDIKKIKTIYYDILIFCVNGVEHHIKTTDINIILGTFYDKDWNQLSGDEIDITDNILNQINNIRFR